MIVISASMNGTFSAVLCGNGTIIPVYKTISAPPVFKTHFKDKPLPAVDNINPANKKR